VNTLSISTDMLMFGTDVAGTQNVVVTTNFTNWTATCPAEWLTLEKQGYTLFITPNELNYSAAQRTATVTITAGNASPATVQVTQEKSAFTFTDCDAYYYGDYYESNTANFELYFYNPSDFKYYLHIEGFSTLPTEGTIFKLDAGNYTVAESMEAKTFFDGLVHDGSLYGSFVYEGNTPKYTLITGGSFNTILLGDTYSINTDFTGIDAATSAIVNNIWFKYIGKISFSDETGDPLAGIGTSDYRATAKPSWFIPPGPSTWDGVLEPNVAQQKFKITGFPDTDWLTYYLKYVDGEILLDDETRTNAVDSKDPSIAGYIRVFCDLDPDGKGKLILWEQGLDWPLEYNEEDGSLEFSWYLEDDDNPEITYPILLGLVPCDETGDILYLWSDLYADVKFNLTPSVASALKMSSKNIQKSASKSKLTKNVAKNVIKLDKSKTQQIQKSQVKILEIKDFQPVSKKK